MQLAVKGSNTPHPAGSWSHNFPPLSTRGTPRQPLGTLTIFEEGKFNDKLSGLHIFEAQNSPEQFSAAHSV